MSLGIHHGSERYTSFAFLWQSWGAEGYEHMVTILSFCDCISLLSVLTSDLTSSSIRYVHHCFSFPCFFIYSSIVATPM